VLALARGQMEVDLGHAERGELADVQALTRPQRLEQLPRSFELTTSRCQTG
jgi:hypothetical protein